MRAILFILILIILVIILALATGFLDINLWGARAPQISATRNGVTVRGGQAPAFDVETGSVKVGTKQTTVKVPALEVQKPAHNVPAKTANSM